MQIPSAKGGRSTMAIAHSAYARRTLGLRVSSLPDPVLILIGSFENSSVKASTLNNWRLAILAATRSNTAMLFPAPTSLP